MGLHLLKMQMTRLIYHLYSLYNYDNVSMPTVSYNVVNSFKRMSTLHYNVVISITNVLQTREVKHVEILFAERVVLMNELDTKTQKILVQLTSTLTKFKKV